jgi:hypothetical protein
MPERYQIQSRLGATVIGRSSSEPVDVYLLIDTQEEGERCIALFEREDYELLLRITAFLNGLVDA